LPGRTCLSKLKSFLNGSSQPLSPPKSIFRRPSRTPEMVTLVTYQVAGNQIVNNICLYSAGK
jgi:hypothetical protein